MIFSLCARYLRAFFGWFVRGDWGLGYLMGGGYGSGVFMRAVLGVL